tara:strand:+ start:200 stop:637 length:438 start_codon:yes stop_codon:yes gene_type:complete
MTTTKAKDVAEYIIWLDSQDDSDGISPLKIQKLVYYAQGFFLAVFDKPLFTDNIEAWRHGPVVPTLWQEYKDCGKNPIPLHSDYKPGLSSEETDLIDEVFNIFGLYSAWGLRNMTHEEQPWIDHNEDRGIISQEELKRYFATRLH